MKNTEKNNHKHKEAEKSAKDFRLSFCLSTGGRYDRNHLHHRQTSSCPARYHSMAL